MLKGVKCDNFQKHKKFSKRVFEYPTYGSISKFILVINRELKQPEKTTRKIRAIYNEGEENVKR